jgi:hypothetical protein
MKSFKSLDQFAYVILVPDSDKSMFKSNHAASAGPMKPSTSFSLATWMNEINFRGKTLT